MEDEVGPFFWFAAQNHDLKLRNRGADWNSAGHNQDASNVVASCDPAGGVCGHRPSIVSHKYASSFRCPCKQIWVRCFGLSDLIRSDCIEVGYAAQESRQYVLIKILIDEEPEHFSIGVRISL